MVWNEENPLKDKCYQHQLPVCYYITNKDITTVAILNPNISQMFNNQRCATGPLSGFPFIAISNQTTSSPSLNERRPLQPQNTQHSQQATAPLVSLSGALSLILLMESLFIKVCIKDTGNYHAEQPIKLPLHIEYELQPEIKHFKRR